MLTLDYDAMLRRSPDELKMTANQMDVEQLLITFRSLPGRITNSAMRAPCAACMRLHWNG